MKILVTGGAGFIGRKLVSSLLKSGFEVTICDNFSNSTEKNIDPLLQKGAKLVVSDITDFNSILKASRGINTVIHLAAKISVEESVVYPELTHQVNVQGSLNVLRACIKNKIKNLVAASSAAVYGIPYKLPLSEKCLTSPLSPYGASKLAMENYIQAFSHSYGLNSIILRFFNIYGKGQSDAYAGVVTKFMNSIKNNKPITIFGDGTQTRDFFSVEDAVQSIRKSIDNVTNKRGKIYNIASGKKISINELAKILVNISNKKIPIMHVDSRKGEIQHSYTSISLAKKELKYHSTINLFDGLNDLMENYSLD